MKTRCEPAYSLEDRIGDYNSIVISIVKSHSTFRGRLHFSRFREIYSASSRRGDKYIHRCYVLAGMNVLKRDHTRKRKPTTMKYSFVVMLCLLLLASCSNGTGPSGTSVSPSTLTVIFTGSTNSGPGSRKELRRNGDPDIGILSACMVTASWTMCTDRGFDSYRLYRSLSPDIASDTSSAVLVADIDSYNSNTYSDKEVTWNTSYYYALLTADIRGSGAWSNEVSITIPQAEAPKPSRLSVEEFSWFYSKLSWTVCPNHNFRYYRLYRSLSPGIASDTSSAVLVTVNDWRLDTCFTDNTIAPSTLYYYAVLTTNTEGISVWSNEVEIRSSDPVPYHVEAVIQVGAKPWDAVAPPFCNLVYVTCRGDDAVAVIDDNDQLTAMVPVGDSPYGICSGPDGKYVYITNWGSGDISVIRTADNTVIATVPVGNRPVNACTLPSGDFLYVTNRSDNTVSVIRISDYTVTDTVEVGINPDGICSSPSGDYVYVSNFASDDLSVIRTSDNTVFDTVSLLTHPAGVCISPSGDYVYVSIFNQDALAVVRTAECELEGTAGVGNGPWGVCVHPTGDYVYVVNSMENTVSILRTSDNKVMALPKVGNSPAGVCITADGTASYVVNYGEGTVSVLR